MTRIKTVLLDRDGTIIYNRHYLSDPNDIEFLPGALDGLRRMRDLGLRMVLITNQSGIGRGYFTEERLREIHDRFEAMLADEGVRLDGIYFCPHTPDDDSDCRKPRTGMVDRAAQELGFDIQDAVMIGDSAADMGLAVTIVTDACSAWPRERHDASLAAIDNLVDTMTADELGFDTDG